MLLRSEVRDANAMMQLLGEVGAQPWPSVAARYDGCGSDLRGMLDARESYDMSRTQQRDICPPDCGG